MTILAPDMLAAQCNFMKYQDKLYGTQPNSPLHHDNRCEKCNPELREEPMSTVINIQRINEVLDFIGTHRDRLNMDEWFDPSSIDQMFDELTSEIFDDVAAQHVSGDDDMEPEEWVTRDYLISSIEQKKMHDSIIEDCGTTGCIAGWTVMLNATPDMLDSFGHSHRRPDGVTVAEYAAELLGLSQSVASDLFLGNWTDRELDHIDAQMVIQQLQFVRDTGTTLRMDDYRYTDWYQNCLDDFPPEFEDVMYDPDGRL